jgi:hypothetical protein
MKWLDYIRQAETWKPIYIQIGPGGRRVVRTIEDVELPDKEELDRLLERVVE